MSYDYTGDQLLFCGAKREMTFVSVPVDGSEKDGR